MPIAASTVDPQPQATAPLTPSIIRHDQPHPTSDHLEHPHRPRIPLIRPRWRVVTIRQKPRQPQLSRHPTNQHPELQALDVDAVVGSNSLDQLDDLHPRSLERFSFSFRQVP